MTGYLCFYFPASAVARLLQVSSPGGGNEGASRRYGRTLAQQCSLGEHTNMRKQQMNAGCSLLSSTLIRRSSIVSCLSKMMHSE